MKGAVMDEQQLREQALASLKRKAEFRTHLIVYILVNALLIVIWAVTSGGFFWPMFPMVGWGVGLGLHAFESYGQRGPTEDRIQREIDRLR